MPATRTGAWLCTGTPGSSDHDSHVARRAHEAKADLQGDEMLAASALADSRLGRKGAQSLWQQQGTLGKVGAPRWCRMPIAPADSLTPCARVSSRPRSGTYSSAGAKLSFIQHAGTMFRCSGRLPGSLARPHIHPTTARSRRPGRSMRRNEAMGWRGARPGSHSLAPTAAWVQLELHYQNSSSLRIRAHPTAASERWSGLHHTCCKGWLLRCQRRDRRGQRRMAA